MEGCELVPLSLPPRDRLHRHPPGPTCPRPISGVTVQDSFPHQPHNFRTSSLFPSPKDSEVGLTVTSSHLQQVKEKPS